MLFTKDFQIFGEIIDNNFFDEILTLKNATVFYTENNLQSEEINNTAKLEWLNLFCQDIIAFSFIE